MLFNWVTCWSLFLLGPCTFQGSYLLNLQLPETASLCLKQTASEPALNVSVMEGGDEHPGPSLLRWEDSDLSSIPWRGFFCLNLSNCLSFFYVLYDFFLIGVQLLYNPVLVSTV